MRDDPFPAAIDTDVLVIGGGITGIAAAYYLGCEGVETVLIDRDEFGSNASAANSGNIHRQLLADNYHRHGWDWFERWASVCRYFTESAGLWTALADAHGEDLAMTRCGGLMLAETDDDVAFLERKAVLERSFGLDAAVVHGNELHSMAPYLTDRPCAAVYCADEGHVNPLAAVPALLDAATRTGAVRAYRFCSVESAAAGPHDFTVETTRGRINARRVVNAAGVDAGRVAAHFGVDLEVNPRHIQTLATEAVEPYIGHLLYHVRGLFTMKQLRNGNVVIGGGWPADLDPRTGRPVTRYQSLTGSLRLASRMVEGAAGLRVLRTWAGYVFAVDDSMPVVGEVPGVANFHNAIPNAFGLTLAPLLGRFTADAITGRAPALDVSPFAIDRPALR